VRKHQPVRKTGRESQRTIRRLLTVYQRQINHQQGQITALENHIRAQELRVSLLQGIRRASTSTLDLGSLFPVLLEMVLDAVAADHGSLLLINPDEKRVLFGIQGAKNGSAMPLGNVSLKQGYRRQIFMGGRTTLIKTLTAPPPGWEMPRFKGGRASLLVIPLQISGRMIGLLELLRPPSAPPFHPQDAELLTTVGHQLGMVMENARLYSEASKQVGQFSTLMELSAILNSTLQFSEVLRRTVEAATRLMECEVGSLLLLNEDGDELGGGGEGCPAQSRRGNRRVGCQNGKTSRRKQCGARCPLSPPGRRPYAFHNAEHDLRTRQEPESDHRGPSGN